MRPHSPVLAAALVCTVLTGCTSTPDSTLTNATSPAATTTATAEPSQSVAPTSTAVQPATGTTPDLVVDQVVVVYFAGDTATDTSPADARVRATGWMTPALAESVSFTNPGGGGVGAEWLDLEAHHGKYVVTSDDATAADPSLPPDTPTTAARARIVTLTPVGTDGWVGQTQTLLVRLHLVKDPDRGWVVDDLTTDVAGDGSGAMDAG